MYKKEKRKAETLLLSPRNGIKLFIHSFICLVLCKKKNLELKLVMGNIFFQREIETNAPFLLLSRGNERKNPWRTKNHQTQWAKHKEQWWQTGNATTNMQQLGFASFFFQSWFRWLSAGEIYARLTLLEHCEKQLTSFDPSFLTSSMFLAPQPNLTY